MFDSIQTHKAYEDEVRYREAQVDETSTITKVLRIALLVLNALLTAAAVVGLVTTLAMKDAIKDSVSALCMNCRHAYVGVVAAFSALAIFSIIGFLALLTRSLWLRVVYAIYLVVVFVVSLTLALTYLLVITKDISLGETWNHIIDKDADNNAPASSSSGGSGSADNELFLYSRAVAADGTFESALCDVQMQFLCTGWVSPCNSSTPYSFHDSKILHCPVCTSSQQETIASYNDTCEDTILSSLGSHKMEVIPVAFVMAGAALISMIVTCLIQRQVSKEESNAGQYYRI